MTIPSRHITPLGTEEKTLLNQLREYAVHAVNRADSKARIMIDWLKQVLKPQGQWTDRRVIIFTEYRKTQKWLHDLLAAEGLAGQDRLLTIYGGMLTKDREEIKAAFQANPADAKVRILLATDAASEGVNLQNHCWTLVHYEIPWNPNRMEQRNGRVDRHGQKNPEVEVFHFVGAGFDETKLGQSPGDLEGDLEFLLRAALKVEAIREDLGKVGPVIADQVEEAMLGRRQALDTQKAERESEPVRKMLSFERKLRDQLQKLSEQLDETKRDLHMSPENTQNVVETGLALARQPSLRPAEVPGLWPKPSGQQGPCPVFYLPPLKDSWGHCVDGLLHPHTKVIRPIVFDHALATGRDDVVLCHLNHRLVQMCLRLLREEVWSQGLSQNLNRFTARLVPDNVLQSPAVVVHGRLLVLGGDNHRVHEEIILAGGQIREGRFARMNVSETQAAYEAATDQAVPGFIEDRLKELWPKVEIPLLQALEVRMQDRTKNLQKFLDDRADKEVTNLTAVIRELEQSIRETLKKEDDPQLKLNLFDASTEEKSQRQRDLNSLRTRLEELPEELTKEIAHLRSRYHDPKPRLFPIAVTFLLSHRYCQLNDRWAH